MSMELLDKSGLAYFWSKIKAWCNATFAAITHSHAWSTITSKPTTISGYGITDAKIANGTITLGSNSITPLTSHQDISGKVNKSGDTMTGDLNVPSVIVSGSFVKEHRNITKGTNPSATNYWTITFADKNGSNYSNNCLGMLETSITSAGVVSTYIRAMKNTAANSSNCQISCIYDTANNTAYTAAPTPATADNSTKIATTAFVKAQGYITSSGSITGNAATATKLATARNINGVSFDGSADVTLTAVVSSASRSADIAANGTFTVPSYIVGAQALLVYLDGCLSRQGDGWSEVGTAGTASTTIKFLQIIPKAMEIVVRVN